MAARLLPLLGLFVLIATIVARVALQMYRHGSSGVILFRSGRREQNVRDALLVILFVAVAGQLLALVMAPGLVSFAMLPWISVPGVLCATGGVLVFLGIVFMVAAQMTLGASWRIGIEESARPGLVTRGFYRFCRNPIFLFMLMILVGFTLLVPTWISLVILLVAIYGIRAQVREEEAYLARTYGDEFREYARRVGRFVPLLGRLR